MTGYSITLFIHVVAVIALFVAMAAEWAYLRHLRQAETVEDLRVWSGLAEGLDKVFPLSSVTIAGSGLYLMQRGWGWNAVRGVAWIDVALLALVALSVIGPTIHGRRFAAIGIAARAAHTGPIPPALARRIHDPVLWTSVQMTAALGFGVVYLMTVKPGLVGSLLVLVVAAVLGVLASAPGWRASSAGRTDELPRYEAAPATEPRVGLADAP